MKNRIPIVIFAQTPPPEHGQSRMVLEALEALRAREEEFEVHHVNARFSKTLDDIGEGSLVKFGLSAKYLWQAILLRPGLKSPLLYYVPGPVKWSSVLRDWFLLGILRIFYSKVVFHWHAIGQGEWSWGGTRQRIPGAGSQEWWAKFLSRRVLDRPYSSLCVVGTSQRDARMVGSRFRRVLHNGIGDPCPDFGSNLRCRRRERLAELASREKPVFRVIFLSHGTEEKGILDALEAIGHAVGEMETDWSLLVTFAGGVSEPMQERFEDGRRELAARYPGRVKVELLGYLGREEKSECLSNHDIFLAASRWESFGLTVVEAMAHGMEVVAAASDGVSGVLPPQHPYMAPVEAPRLLGLKLAECCREMLEGGAGRHGEDLRERYLEHFQLEDFSRRLRTLMLELAHGQVEGEKRLRCQVYLADQNPGHDRSFGISRMSQVVLEALDKTGEIRLSTVVSRSSQQADATGAEVHMLGWGTRRKWARSFTDHLHPLLPGTGNPDLYYYPKGYLPLACGFARPSVVTIHDTIIQYDEDHYPRWRSRWEYRYWASMLKHTLSNADRLLTVSESSKAQIEAFRRRHQLPEKPITVTYEPCSYEFLPQPESPAKENFVIHLASREPHKRTAHLVRWWREAEGQNQDLPTLHLIGTVPDEVAHLLASSRTIVKRPFLEEEALVAAYQSARALILPSEIEGFGLPALEAYYLGTPVCFVKGTSVEEVLGVATSLGGFELENPDSLFAALAGVMAMPSDEVRRIGLSLREHYASEKVARRMLQAFREVVGESKMRAGRRAGNRDGG